MRSIDEITLRLLDLASTQCGMPRASLRPEMRVLRDLHLDSLSFVELIMAIEDEFEIAWPDQPDDPATASVSRGAT